MCLPDLLKYVLAELVCADVALGTAAVLAASAQEIVVAAVVVAMEGAVAPAQLVTVAADVTVAALNQAAQEPCAGFGATWVPLRVVTTGALERVAVDDRCYRDRDPLLAWTIAVSESFGGAVHGRGLARQLQLRFKLPDPRPGSGPLYMLAATGSWTLTEVDFLLRNPTV